jgi:hypothetical protein
MIKEKDVKKIIGISFPFLENKCQVLKGYKKDFFILKFND